MGFLLLTGADQVVARRDDCVKSLQEELSVFSLSSQSMRKTYCRDGTPQISPIKAPPSRCVETKSKPYHHHRDSHRERHPCFQGKMRKHCVDARLRIALRCPLSRNERLRVQEVVDTLRTDTTRRSGGINGALLIISYLIVLIVSFVTRDDPSCYW